MKLWHPNPRRRNVPMSRKNRTEFSCRAAGGDALCPGEGDPADARGRGLQRNHEGSVGGVQALSEEHLRQVLLPDVQQRIRNGGTSGQDTFTTVLVCYRQSQVFEGLLPF